MAQLIDNYNFGFPLNTVEDLNNVEQNIVTDDKYVSTLVSVCWPNMVLIWMRLINYEHFSDCISQIEAG